MGRPLGEPPGRARHHLESCLCVSTSRLELSFACFRVVEFHTRSMVFCIVASALDGTTYQASLGAHATWKLVRQTFRQQLNVALPFVGVCLPRYEGLVAHSFGYEPDVVAMWAAGTDIEIPLHIFLHNIAAEACHVCGARKDERVIQACSRCRCVRYCSRACQAQHWPMHRLVCGTI